MKKVLGKPGETNKKLISLIERVKVNNFYLKNKKDFRDQILNQILESDDVLDIGKSMRDKFSKIKRNIKNISSGNYRECDNLIHEISKFPDIVNKSANTLQPHVIIYYLKDLSQLFHSFYNDNHVLSESDENMQSILECLIAVKQVISNGLNLLGITPMQKM